MSIITRACGMSGSGQVASREWRVFIGSQTSMASFYEGLRFHSVQENREYIFLQTALDLQRESHKEKMEPLKRQDQMRNFFFFLQNKHVLEAFRIEFVFVPIP